MRTVITGHTPPILRKIDWNNNWYLRLESHCTVSHSFKQTYYFLKTPAILIIEKSVRRILRKNPLLEDDVLYCILVSDAIG